MGDQNNYTSLLYGDMLSRYGKHIVRYCYFRAKNYSEAMELIQEVEVALWESLGTMRATTPRQTTSWVNSVMRNTISNHFRRKRLKTIPLEQAAGLPLADDADLEQLHSLIAYLDPDEQRLLKQLFDGYSRAEIAAAEGLTVGAIHQRMHRIVNRLKEINKKMYLNPTPSPPPPPAGAKGHRREPRPRKRAPVSYSTPCRGIRRPPSCAPAGRQKRGQPASTRGRCPRLSSYAPGGAQAVSAANDMDCHATP